MSTQEGCVKPVIHAIVESALEWVLRHVKDALVGTVHIRCWNCQKTNRVKRGATNAICGACKSTLTSKTKEMVH